MIHQKKGSEERYFEVEGASLHQLAIPNILSNLSVPLLSTIDLALMGHFRDVVFLDAVALGGLIFNFLYWGFGFLRMGTTGLTAQAFGQQRKHEIRTVLARSVLLAFGLGCCLVVMKQPIEAVAFWLLKGSAGVEDQARVYLSIRIWAAPAALTLHALSGWFLGMQNSVYAMAVMIALNLLNVVFNCVLVLSLGMSADGVALGTVFAQYAGLLIAVVLLLRRYPEYVRDIPWSDVRDWNPLVKYLILNRDIFLRTLCLMLVFGSFLNWSAAAGNIMLAVNSILKQFYVWVAYVIDGYAYAAESLVGRFHGAKDSVQLRAMIKRLFMWGMGSALAFSCIIAVFGESLLHVFTRQHEVLEAARPFVVWMVVLPLVSAPAFIWDGIFVGMTAVKAMLITMLLSSAIFFVAHWSAQSLGWGNHGLWLAFTVFNGSRALLQWGVMSSRIGRRLL